MGIGEFVEIMSQFENNESLFNIPPILPNPQFETNSLLSDQISKLKDLETQLELSNEKIELSNEKVDFLKEQLETSNNRIGELQSHLEKEREERLAGEKSAKTHVLIATITAIIGTVIGIIGLVPSILQLFQ